MHAFESETWTSWAALALVASAVAMGVAISLRFMFPFLSVVECVAAGPPLGLTLSVWIAMILKSYVYTRTLGQPIQQAWVGSFIQAAIAYRLWQGVQARWDARAAAFASATVAALKKPLVVIAALSLWLSYIQYTHSLGRWGDGYMVGGTVYGDMPFHLGVITSLLWGANGCVSLPLLPLLAPVSRSLPCENYVCACYEGVAGPHAIPTPPAAGAENLKLPSAAVFGLCCAVVRDILRV